MRFEKSLPLCIMADVFILLLSGVLFHNLTIGIAMLAICIAACAITTIAKERQRYREFALAVFTPGFYAFLVGYIFV
jgi:hypothetical protein